MTDTLRREAELTTRPAEAPGGRRRFPDRLLRRAAGSARWSAWWDGAVVALSASVLFVVGFGGGPGMLSRPLGGGDLLGSYATAHAWSNWAPFGDATLGYPFGMDLRYYPTADLIPNLVAGLFGHLSGNPFFGMNLMFAASFPVTALAAYWVFRVGGLGRTAAGVAALALTFVPYHWYRIFHVYLGTMYSAVLGVGLALLIGNGTVERRLRSRGRLGFGVLLLVLAAVIAASGIYYACFTVLLCLAALAYRFLHRSSVRGLLTAALPIVAVVALLAVVLAPAELYVSSHPSLSPVAGRVPVESVAFSGALAFALLPAPISLIPGFGPVNELVSRAIHDATALPSAGVIVPGWYTDSGSVATTAALAVLLVGGLMLGRRSARPGGPATPVVPAEAGGPVTLGFVGLLLTTALLFFVPWGLNFLFAQWVTPQLRGWDRLVPVLFTLVLLGAGLVLQRLVPRWNRGAAAGAIAVGLAVILLDSVLPYRAVFASYSAQGSPLQAAGAAYATALNAAVPERCGVLELPYIAFPEEPNKVGMGNYEHFWVALTNPGKLWSFGAVKGTEASVWQQTLGDSLSSGDIRPLEKAGFCAVHVDKRGYSPEDAARVTTQLESLLGKPVASGLDGNWLAYRLPASGVTAVSSDWPAHVPADVRDFFEPAQLTPAPATPAAPEGAALRPTWALSGGAARFDLRAIDGAPFRSFGGQLQSRACGEQDVAVQLRAGSMSTSTTVHLGAGEAAPFSVELPRSAGAATVTVTTSAPQCASPVAVALVGPRTTG